MLTYQKVLEAFGSYLEEDRSCEAVSTSRGYIVLLLDSYTQRWYDFKEAPTPTALRDALLESYRDYLTYEKADLGERDEPTEQEKQKIEAMCMALLENCR